jgi:Fe-S oxidoreductase
MINAIVMSLLLVAALGFFSFTMYGRVRLLMTGKPDVRWDKPVTRFMEMLKVAFFQTRLFKEPVSGLVHALIFWGFLILLFRSISVVGRAYASDWSSWSIMWFWPAADHIYTWLKDWTELVVLAMVVWSIFRRAVLKPERLHNTFAAYLILGFIGTLMVTDFLYDGARFALLKAGYDQIPAAAAAAMNLEMANSPIGSFVSTWFAGVSAGKLMALWQICFWVHIVVLFTFLNELPLGKHFHVILAIPNVFFSRLTSPGAIEPIKDIEEQETFGVLRPTELTWKQMMDGFACTECGRCTVNCPAHQTGKPLSPRELICDMRDFVKAHEKDIIKGVDLGEKLREEGKSLIDAIKDEVIWECTTCRSCEEQCPVNITHVDKIIGYRRYLTLMEASMDNELAVCQKNLENKSNPWGLPSGERGMWLVEEMEVPLLSDKPDAEYLFFLGCSGAYDDRNQKVARAFVKLMRAAGVDFAILGPEEGCCGDTARRLGNEYLFQAQAAQNIEVFNGYNVKKIVTMCPHGYNTIKNEYPQFGGNYEVIHHSVLLAQLIKEGKLKLDAPAESVKAVYHDSCYLGRYNEIYDEPRDAAKAAGLTLVEADRSRKTGMCCGAGGGMMFRDEKEGTRVNRLRVSQLAETGASKVVSACPFCLVMCRDGINEEGVEERLSVADIAEVLAERLPK